MHSLWEALTIAPSLLFRFIRSFVGHVRSFSDPTARPLLSSANREIPCPSSLQTHMSSDCQRIPFAYLAFPTTQSSTVQRMCTFRPSPTQLIQQLVA